MRVFTQLYTVHHFLDSILCPLMAKASFPFASALQDPCFSVRRSRFRCVCFLLLPGLEFTKQCKIKSKPNCLQLAARLPLSIRALQPPCRSEVDLFSLLFLFSFPFQCYQLSKYMRKKTGQAALTPLFWNSDG